MKYTSMNEDLRAIMALQKAGKIDASEAHEMRDYVESLA